MAEPTEAVKQADLVAVLTPDMAQPKLYTDAIEPNLKPGAALLFAHGFNIHFKQIKPRKDLDVVLMMLCSNQSHFVNGAVIAADDGFGV